MRITIFATSSRSDIQPYLALGMELKKEDAQVQVATFENYKSFIESHGLEF